MILLKKFLTLKIDPPKIISFLLYTKKLSPIPEGIPSNPKEEFIPLAADTTLDEIETELCPEGTKVIIYYSVMAINQEEQQQQQMPLEIQQ
jgi:hypothetical protein